jgi:hypothetical protein
MLVLPPEAPISWTNVLTGTSSKPPVLPNREPYLSTRSFPVLPSHSSRIPNPASGKEKIAPAVDAFTNGLDSRVEREIIRLRRRQSDPAI